MVIIASLAEISVSAVRFSDNFACGFVFVCQIVYLIIEYSGIALGNVFTQEEKK